MKTKIFLVGPLLTRSGYGEQARFALRALRSREDLFDIYVHPLQWGATSWIAEYDEEKQWIDNTIEKTLHYVQAGGKPDVSLQVTIPNEWKKISPINIGYTAGIETTQVSNEWLQAGNQMDNILVVSNHSKNVYESTSYTGVDEATGQTINLACATPINVVNYPVKTFSELPELDLELSGDVNFLSVAQWGPRKNFVNMVRWFIQEFKDEDVGLVVKTNIAKYCLIDRENCEGQLKQLVSEFDDKRCKIYLLHGDMTDEEMHALYKHPKISAFVGIPHGEGFGLPIFEAAYSGLPVVTVGWSGQLDYLIDESGNANFYEVAYDIQKVQKEVVWPGVLIEESGWAYARETSYKNQLRKCYEDIQNNSGLVASAEDYANSLHERFSQEVLYEQFIEALNLNIDHEWAQTLSSIEII